MGFNFVRKILIVAAVLSILNDAYCFHQVHRRHETYATNAKISAEEFLLRHYAAALPSSKSATPNNQYANEMYNPHLVRPLPLPRQEELDVAASSSLTITAGASKQRTSAGEFNANIVTNNDKYLNWSPSSMVGQVADDDDEFSAQQLAEKFQHVTLDASCHNEPPVQQPINPVFLLAANLYTAMIFVAGIIGNMLVLFTVLCYSKMHTVTNIFLFCLAVSDMCFTLAIPMLLMAALMNSWIFGNVMCKIFYSLTTLNQFTSSFFLMILALDRYIATCLPFTLGTRRTTCKAVVICIITWCVAILMIVPVYVCSVVRPSIARVDSYTCTIDFNWPFKHLTNNIGYVLYCFVIGFALPATCIIFCYASVILRLRSINGRIKSSISGNYASTTITHMNEKQQLTHEHNNTPNNINNKNKNSGRKLKQNKITKLVLAIITTYLLCSTPYWIAQITLTLKVLFEHEHWIETIAVIEENKNVAAPFSDIGGLNNTDVLSSPDVFKSLFAPPLSSRKTPFNFGEEAYTDVSETDPKSLANFAESLVNDNLDHDPCPKDTKPQEFNMVYIYFTIQCIMYTNSATNPIIVFLLNESFHRGFLRLLYVLCSKISDHSTLFANTSLFRKLREKTGTAHTTEAAAPSASHANNHRAASVAAAGEEDDEEHVAAMQATK